MASKRVEELIASMSLEEKLGEMTQLAPFFFGVDESMDLTGPMAELGLQEEDIKYIGSTLNSFGAEKNIAMQKKHMAEQPHGIPLLFMADVIHGFRTIFPIPLAMGCSFQPAACEDRGVWEIPDHAYPRAPLFCVGRPPGSSGGRKGFGR